MALISHCSCIWLSQWPLRVVLLHIGLLLVWCKLGIRCCSCSGCYDIIINWHDCAVMHRYQCINHYKTFMWGTQIITNTFTIFAACRPLDMGKLSFIIYKYPEHSFLQISWHSFSIHDKYYKVDESSSHSKTRSICSRKIILSSYSLTYDLMTFSQFYTKLNNKKIVFWRFCS